MCIEKLFQKIKKNSNQKNTSKLTKLHMKYFIMKFMMQNRMPENFCSDDLIRNIMVFIKPEAQSHKNSRTDQKLSIFCDIAEKLYSRNTIVTMVDTLVVV
jgi:hypothetical protein